MLYYVDYYSVKGGINNFQVVRVTLDDGTFKRFTSFKRLAEKRARSWINKQERNNGNA